MTRQPLIARRAEELLGTSVVATAPVAGGDIATATRLRLSDGTSALMKTLPHAPEDFFTDEAEGLRWLAEAGGAAVPDVLAVDHECLIIRWVEPGRNTVDAAASFGRELAATHAAGAEGFGRTQDGYIGRLPLPNRPTDTWAEFYAVRRVLPYLKLARDRGHVDGEQSATIEAVVARLPGLVPDEPPARLHGDLWNGNVLWGVDGRAWLLDPAAYGGPPGGAPPVLSPFALPHPPRGLGALPATAPLARRRPGGPAPCGPAPCCGASTVAPG